MRTSHQPLSKTAAIGKRVREINILIVSCAGKTRRYRQPKLQSNKERVFEYVYESVCDVRFHRWKRTNTCMGIFAL